MSLKAGLVDRPCRRIGHIDNIWRTQRESLDRSCSGWRFLGWGRRRGRSGYGSGNGRDHLIGLLGLLLLWVLDVAELVFASWFSVLEPVKDVGVTNLPILLQLSPDSSYLVPGRIHHARVENWFQYANLLRFWVPPRLWLWAAFFTSRNCCKIKTAGSLGGEKENWQEQEWVSECVFIFIRIVINYKKKNLKSVINC